MKPVKIHKMDGSIARVELPDAPWYMATIYGNENGPDEDVYMREVVVFGANDAKTARAVTSRGLDKGETIGSCQKTDYEMAAYFLHQGEVIYA